MNRDQLARQLEIDEGKKPRMYLDTAGKWTIGIGFNLSDCAIPEHIIQALLDYKIEEAERELDRALPWWRTLNDARQNALLNIVFNIGMPRLLGFSKSLELLKAGRWDAAASEFLNSKWAKQVGSRAKRVTDLIRKGEFPHA